MKLSVITPTHDLTHLPATWLSLREQTYDDFEWIVVVNGPRAETTWSAVYTLVENDPRVKVEVHGPFVGVGAAKKHAFGLGSGDVLVELDHDDLLVPTALAEVARAFEDEAVGFVYSDCADFQDGAVSQGDVTYLNAERRAAWMAEGWTFREEDVAGSRAGRYLAANMFELTAHSVSSVLYAPNHVRAWRRSVYEEVGGHDESLPVCDDHQLVVRTYLATKMVHIAKVLYLYRVTGNNTWLKNVEEIQRRTLAIQHDYLERLVLRECALKGLPAYDLGGGISPRAGWTPVDKRPVRDGDHEDYWSADLSHAPWPFETSSVGAFRASDFLEHLPDKTQTMSEIHRCLRPGGWLLSMTPSTDGRGAWQDPTHVSYWNENSMWYYTRRDLAHYIGNTDVRFQAVHLDSIYPSPWHQDHAIPYVRANLVALKDGYAGPGPKLI